MEDDIKFEKDADLIETENRIGELIKKGELSEEEKTELAEKKKHRQSRYQERITELHSEREFYKNRMSQLEEENKTLKSSKVEPKEDFKPASSLKEQVTINGEKYYTDRALRSMIEAGEMSQDDAWQHQQDRIASLAAEKMEKRAKQSEIDRQVNDTREEVLKEYPHFNQNHPKHDPNDPLFKEASRIYEAGYKYNPKGMKLAIEEAKKILRLSNNRPDLSDDLGANPSKPNSEPNQGGKKLELSDWEKEHAERLYVFSGLSNPATGKPYTKVEAYERALKAKSNRQQAAV